MESREEGRKGRGKERRKKEGWMKKARRKENGRKGRRKELREVGREIKKEKKQH